MAKCTGIYRKDHWVMVVDGEGVRSALDAEQYVINGCTPPLDELMDDVEFHQRVLAGEISG